MRHILRLSLLPLCLAVFFSCSSKTVIENPTAEQRFHMGMDEYKKENYLEAVQHFDVIRMQFMASAIADSAKFYAGLCRFNREEYLLARFEFSQLIQNFPKSPLLQESYWMYAECYYKLSPRVDLDQEYTKSAIDALQTFMESYPQNSHAREAEQQLHELVNKLAEKEYNTGTLYMRMENNSSALVYFNNIIDRFYNTDFVDDAMVQKIRILVKRQRIAEAADLVQNFLRKYPDSPYRSEMEEVQKSLAAQPAKTN